MSYYDGHGNLLDTDFSITDTRLNQAVSRWLEENPDATTTVQDGAISTAKLAEDAVTPEKTSFLEPVCKMLESVCVLPNATKVNRYADQIDNLYFGTYLISSPDRGIFAVEVEAGKTYTIIPCVDSVGVYFCKTYAVQEAPEKAKVFWTGDDELLGILSYSGEGRLCSASIKSYEDRQRFARYTPAADGYIVGTWDMVSGAFVYEGPSPWAAWEEFLDDTVTEYTSANYPLKDWQKIHTEKLLALSRRVEPGEELRRLLRRGEYYGDLICSNLTVNCLGDGNTLGASQGDGFGDLLAAKLGLSVRSCGVEGAAVTNGYGAAIESATGANGFITAFLDNTARNAGAKYFDDPCVFTIALGTHDWLSSAPMGSYQDSADTTSFYGCYKKLIARIRELYPRSAIILMTPWQLFYNGVHWYESNGRGYSIRDYSLAIHEIAMMTRNCWVLDMLNSAYITELSGSEEGVYADEIHLGKSAQILIAHELEKLLMQILMAGGCSYVPLASQPDAFTGQR